MHKPLYDRQPMGCRRVWIGSDDDGIVHVAFDCRTLCRRTTCNNVFMASMTSPEMQASEGRLGIKRTLKPDPLPVYARERWGAAIGPGYCPCSDDCGGYIPEGEAWFIAEVDGRIPHSVGRTFVLAE